MPRIVETDIRPTPKSMEETIKGLSKDRRDWLEVHGNQWKQSKVMPGTCEACVWGTGEHAAICAAD